MRKFKLEMPTNGNAFQKFATNALILFSIKIMMNMTFVVMVARGVGDVGRLVASLGYFRGFHWIFNSNYIYSIT